MTSKEAIKVLKIMATADGGCVVCDLFLKFKEQFPKSLTNEQIKNLAKELEINLYLEEYS